MGDLSERPQARNRQNPAHKQMPWLPQEKRRPGAGQEEMRRLPAVEKLERKDRKGNFEDKNVRLQVLQILQQNAKRKQRNNLQLYRNHRAPKALSSGKLPGSRSIPREAEINGNESGYRKSQESSIWDHHGNDKSRAGAVFRIWSIYNQIHTKELGEI